MQRSLQQAAVKHELWRLVIPVLWFGMVAAISFIEAPLKFQAPGITIPLGLGIGRLVFFALNVAEGILLVATLLLAFLPGVRRLAAARLSWVLALAAVFIVKITVIRPPLNARTDQVLAGADPGQSPWHYIYIAADVITMVLLIVIAVQAARAILARFVVVEQGEKRN
ncbi:hypothetical protein QBL02_01800 [Leucobacter sp. UT-8R-CII-1-4]|uniref:hypothetical protein n=1 Tax=Leucobacter sp. UT-8R-CII-1-4 TaxID=3040075 RepID=UPI0024A832FF|nr:hypothetical protein [Leucobacter sp. UT-8R-CII-1-4]MDI6022275.1 hypothetical protein [Leucobacter sp. UT-8R-CII-1-4]